MRGRSEIWLSRASLWVPALVFLAANAALFAFHRGLLATRVAGFEARYRESAQQAERLERQAGELSTRLDEVRGNDDRREQLYRDWFATPDQRLTASIAEVKQLASRSGLEIQAISYPQEMIASYGLSRRSFRFSVEGSYPALRQLVYLIEMTPSFLVLERIQVGEVRAGGDLRAELELSTLFSTGEADGRPSS